MADHAPTDPPSAADSDPLIGQEVGGAYRIVRLIGAGGMGSVYEARHLRLNRRCAVKVLLRSLQDDPTYLERFRREAEVTSRLRNRHICEVIDFAHLPDGSPYLAMEYLEGEDLATRVRRRPLTGRELAPILEGVGSALAAAHKIGVLHRDIKPANVFIARTAEGAEIAKLLDFGAAKRQGHDSNLTATGQVLGSVWYVSPEQARGQELDFRTDIFSLGILVFEALTGRNPFEAPSPTETLFKIVSDPAPSLRGLPGLAPSIDEVMGRALAKRREDRFPSVVDFVEAALPVLDPSRRAGRTTGESPAARPPPPPSEARPASPGGPSLAAAHHAALRAMAERGLLHPTQLEQAEQWVRTEGELLFDKLVASGFIDERNLLRFVAGSSGYKYITAETLAKSRVPTAAVARLPAQLAEARCVAPLAYNPVDGQLTIAVPEPSQALLDEVKQVTGAPSVQAILALRGTIRAAIKRFYPAEALSAAALAGPAPQRMTPAPFPAGAPPPPVRSGPFDSPPAAVSPTGPTMVPDLPPPPPAPTTNPDLDTRELAREAGREPDTAEGTPDGAIIDPLVAANLLTADGLEQARQLQRDRGGFLGDAILRLGVVKEVDFLRTFAELYGTRFVKSDKVVKVSFDQGLLDQIPARMAEELRVIPFARHAATQEIHVIAAVPLHPEIEPRVRQLTGARSVTVYLATPGAVQAALRRWYYGDLSVLSEVTGNGAGPGPMRPRSAPGSEPEPEREDPSQKTVQVELDDPRTGAAASAVGERALIELQRRLPLDGDPGKVLDAFLDVRRLESAALLLEDGRKAVRGLRALVGEAVPRARVEQALQSRQPLYSEDLRSDPLLGATQLVRDKGIRAALTLPLLGRTQVLGVLHVDAPGPLAEDERADLAVLAELAALRIEDGAALTRALDDQRQQLVQDRFLPPSLRAAAHSGNLSLPAEGERIQATLLYLQLRDFEDLGGRLSAPELLASVNRAYAQIAEVLHKHGGSIAELHGNKLLALWSPALGTEADAHRAIEAALALQHQAGAITVGGRPAGLRLGLHSGLVTLGRMGLSDRLEFNVVGGAVKIAARMASLALEGQALASETTLSRAGAVNGLKPIPIQAVEDLGPRLVAYLIGARAAEELALGAK